MTTIKGTVKAGRLEVNVPPDWPDGTEVEIHPLADTAAVVAEETNAAEIARILAAMDRIVPFEMSETEQAAWEAERRADIEREKAGFAQRSDELRRMWD